MTEEKEDRRVRRTKKMIEEALLRLMKREHLQKITVSELAREADITRSTFYQYYSDPLQVLQRLQQSVIGRIQEIIDTTAGGDSYGFFLTLLEYMASDDSKAELLMLDNGSGTGLDFIGNSIHNNYMLRWGQDFSEDKTRQYEYYRYYIVFGCIAVVRSWLEGGKKEPPEQMARILCSLLPREKMYLKPDR